MIPALILFIQPSDEKVTKINDREAGTCFVRSIGSWLTDNRDVGILNSVRAGAKFPIYFNHVQDEVEFIEQLSIDATKAFAMPDNLPDVESHKYTILGTSLGHCSLVESVGKKKSKGK